jgi:hypothetical protein
MKKNLWVLLALSALIAMFVIAGCAPKPSPSPSPSPTTEPTAPPADTAAPKVVSTEVFKYYGSDYCPSCLYDVCLTVNEEIYCCENSGLFKVVINFDENIDTLVSSCMLNPGSWTVDVSNSGRLAPSLIPLADINAIVFDVEIDGKQVILTAGVIEAGVNVVYPNPAEPLKGVDVPYAFCGLICNANDADLYAAEVNGPYGAFAIPGVISAPSTADLIEWELSDTCVVADELGNVNCGYKGSDCCLEATCDSCDEGCPFSDPTCTTCVNPCE